VICGAVDGGPGQRDRAVTQCLIRGWGDAVGGEFGLVVDSRQAPDTDSGVIEGMTSDTLPMSVEATACGSRPEAAT
jgi:hypothetical protein